MIMTALSKTFLRIYWKNDPSTDFEFLLKEIYVLVNDLLPHIMSELSTILENPYNLKNFQIQYSSNKKQ